MRHSRVAIIIIYAVVVIWWIWVIFPLYWAGITSVKTSAATLRRTNYVPWVDFQPTLDPWRDTFLYQGDQLSQGYRNTLINSIFSAIIATILGTMAGYGLLRFRYKFGPLRNKDILIWIISQRMLPPAVVMLPYFLMFHALRLLDTHIGMILVYTVFNLPLAVWLGRSYVSEVPVAIEEAALVDGASRIRTLFTIVIPLIIPGLVGTFLFCLIMAWNEFLLALILTFENAKTLPVMLAQQESVIATNYWVISVMVLVSIAPMVVITLFFQKYMIRGLATGALK